MDSSPPEKRRSRGRKRGLIKQIIRRISLFFSGFETPTFKVDFPRHKSQTAVLGPEKRERVPNQPGRSGGFLKSSLYDRLEEFVFHLIVSSDFQAAVIVSLPIKTGIILNYSMNVFVVGNILN